MSDPDYSPAFQDEYQRLWHEAAAERDKFKALAQERKDAWRWAEEKRTEAEADLAEARELLGEIARGNGYGDHVACTHTRCDCAKIWNEKARAFLAAQDGGSG